MAVEQTQVLPAPVLEGALTAFTKKLTPLIGQQIDTTKFDPQVAAQTQLQKDASAAAAGLGSLVGPQAFQPFMSPYQQEVIDTTLAEFDRQQAIQQTGLRDAAITAGAFGGARQGLAQFQQQMGQADQGFAQAQLDAQQLAAREAQFEPFTRLGLIGQQLSQIQPGAFPTTTVGFQSSAPPASPLASFLGGAAGAGGVLGKLGIFG